MEATKLSSNVRRVLDELKRALESIFGARFKGLYLYGSYARGEATSNSDIDVMIVLSGDAKPADEIDRISEAVADICLRYDILISTFPVSENWYAERQSPFFINVRREGVLV
jgi:predicted nucleotidyltransferase